MQKKTKCPVCNSESKYQSDFENLVLYSCPICGRFEISLNHQIDYNHLSSFLLYNGFKDNYDEYRYHTFLKKELCDEYSECFENGDKIYGKPVYMDEEIVENWYPKTFSEKIDKILLFLDSKTNHTGQQITVSCQELFGAFFIDRKEKNTSSSGNNSWEFRKKDDCQSELEYMLDYLSDQSYIKYHEKITESELVHIHLLPNGYTRIDELQKSKKSGRNVLVAMRFGEDTKPLRESIREGITNAGYIAIFIDEVQHNDFITPELLKYIRDSRFVVVDLTHKNNGAYFEEGYAMGLGKPVVQLCQKDTKLHFDIAQKNTIIWDTESDIPERLTNRIKATID